MCPGRERAGRVGEQKDSARGDWAFLSVFPSLEHLEMSWLLASFAFLVLRGLAGLWLGALRFDCRFASLPPQAWLRLPPDFRTLVANSLFLPPIATGEFSPLAVVVAAFLPVLSLSITLRLASSIPARFENASRNQIGAADLRSQRGECETTDPIHTRQPTIDSRLRFYANHQKRIRFWREIALSVSIELHFPRVRTAQNPFNRRITIAPNLFTTRSTPLHLLRQFFKSGYFVPALDFHVSLLRASLPKHLRILRHFFRRFRTDRFRDLIVRLRTEIHRGLHVRQHVRLPPIIETFAQQSRKLRLLLLRKPLLRGVVIRRVFEILLCDRRELLNPLLLIKLLLSRSRHPLLGGETWKEASRSLGLSAIWRSLRVRRSDLRKRRRDVFGASSKPMSLHS